MIKNGKSYPMDIPPFKDYLEFLMILAAVLLFVSYHLGLSWRIHHHPKRAAYGRNRAVRRKWVETFHGSGQEVLVIQAIRNWILSTNFLASTGIFLTVGLLGVASTSKTLSGLVHEINMIGSVTERVLLGKLLLLSFIFFAAFFCFSLATRSFIHSSFLITLEPDINDPHTSRKAVDELERGALLYFIGLRFYYLSVPFTMWIFGPIWMFLGTIILLLVLIRID